MVCLWFWFQFRNKQCGQLTDISHSRNAYVALTHAHTCILSMHSDRTSHDWMPKIVPCWYLFGFVLALNGYLCMSCIGLSSFHTRVNKLNNSVEQHLNVCNTQTYDSQNFCCEKIKWELHSWNNNVSLDSPLRTILLIWKQPKPSLIEATTNSKSPSAGANCVSVCWVVYANILNNSQKICYCCCCCFLFVRSKGKS